MIFPVVGGRKLDIDIDLGSTGYIIIGAVGGTVVLVFIVVLVCTGVYCIRRNYLMKRRYHLSATEG